MQRNSPESTQRNSQARRLAEKKCRVLQRNSWSLHKETPSWGGPVPVGNCTKHMFVCVSQMRAATLHLKSSSQPACSGATLYSEEPRMKTRQAVGVYIKKLMPCKETPGPKKSLHKETPGPGTGNWGKCWNPVWSGEFLCKAPYCSPACPILGNETK